MTYRLGITVHTIEQNSSKKRTSNLTLNSGLLDEAKNLGINVSQSAELGIKQAVKEAKQRLWLKENRAALESSNTYVEKHGLPLAKHRQF